MTIEQAIERKLGEPIPEAADHLGALLPGGDEPALVFAYGSCISTRTRTPSSFFDFYVVADRPARYLRAAFGTGALQGALARVLPPSVYHRTAGGRRMKVCVVSREQLRRETGPRARDIHHLGRFSKRMALLHARDDASRAEATGFVASALRTLHGHALALLSAGHSDEDFALTLLRLSYLGEQRVAEDDKVRALYEAERDYYRTIFSLLRAEPPAMAPDRTRTERFLAKSRRRGLCRWPKYVLTVDGWLDILLDKLERHHGVKLELTERQRRWPLIFGWSKYFQMRRRGIVR
jgi:hypothetical protein